MMHHLKQKPQVKNWPVHPGRIVREDLRELGPVPEGGTP